MKPALLSRLMLVLLILGVSACAPRPAAHIGPASEAPKAEVAVSSSEAVNLAEAPTTDVAAVAEGHVTPRDALKLMLIQLLVAR